MNYLHVSDDLAAVVATQMKAGRSLQQIARDMHVSVQVVACAASRAALIERTRGRESESSQA
jgi:hypothetical protein